MAETADDPIASWQERIGTLRKRGRVAAAALTVVPAGEEVDVRRGRPSAPARIRAGTATLGAAHLQPQTGLVRGGRGAARKLRHDDFSGAADRGRVAQGQTGYGRALSKVGPNPSTLGGVGGHVSDAAAADAIVEARQAHAHGRRAAGRLTKTRATYPHNGEKWLLKEKGSREGAPRAIIPN